MIMRDSVDEEPSYSSYGFSYRHTTGQSAPAAVTLSPRLSRLASACNKLFVCYHVSNRCVKSISLPSYTRDLVLEIIT